MKVSVFTSAVYKVCYNSQTSETGTIIPLIYVEISSVLRK